MATEVEIASGRRKEPGNHVDDCRLPRAIVPEEGEDCALPYIKVDAIYCTNLARASASVNLFDVVRWILLPHRVIPHLGAGFHLLQFCFSLLAPCTSKMAAGKSMGLGKTTFNWGDVAEIHVRTAYAIASTMSILHAYASESTST